MGDINLLAARACRRLNFYAEVPTILFRDIVTEVILFTKTSLKIILCYSEKVSISTHTLYNIIHSGVTIARGPEGHQKTVQDIVRWQLQLETGGRRSHHIQTGLRSYTEDN